MKKHRLGLTLGVLALLALGVGAWWFFGRSGEANGGDGKTADAGGGGGPTARVQTVPARRGEVARTVTAFGTAVAASGGTQSVAFPYESRVASVRANVGQSVAAGDELLKIEPSADARLALNTAGSTRDAADRALRDVRGRYKLHLATNQELAAAEGAVRDADLRYKSLQDRGPGADGLVRAPAAGVVTKIPAQPGAVVPAGSPLVEVAVENRFEARLGVEPPDALEVKAGQPAQLSPVEPRHGGNGGVSAPLAGTVRVVGQSVDATTRLVDVFVSLDEPAPVDKLLIGTYLRADIVVEKKEALLVPRPAALPNAQGDSATLFTVRGGKAVKHEIHTGIDDGTNVEVLLGGDDPEGGAPVVTQGNYELEDGMAVQVETPSPGEGTPSP